MSVLHCYDNIRYEQTVDGILIFFYRTQYERKERNQTAVVVPAKPVYIYFVPRNTTYGTSMEAGP